MSPNCTRLLSLIAIFGAACGSGGQADSTLNHYDQELSQALDQAEATSSAHHRQALQQTTLLGMRGLEPGYMNQMNDHVAMMHDAQHGIAECGSGNGDHAWQSMHDANGAMGTAMDQVATELDRHAHAMHNASDLESGMTEEHTHQTNMENFLNAMGGHDGDMMEAMHAMMQSGASMMCSNSGYMHH